MNSLREKSYDEELRNSTFEFMIGYPELLRKLMDLLNDACRKYVQFFRVNLGVESYYDAATGAEEPELVYDLRFFLVRIMFTDIKLLYSHAIIKQGRPAQPRHHRSSSVVHRFFIFMFSKLCLAFKSLFSS